MRFQLENVNKSLFKNWKKFQLENGKKDFNNWKESPKVQKSNYKMEIIPNVK